MRGRGVAASMTRSKRVDAGSSPAVRAKFECSSVGPVGHRDATISFKRMKLPERTDTIPTDPAPAYSGEA